MTEQALPFDHLYDMLAAKSRPTLHAKLDDNVTVGTVGVGGTKGQSYALVNPIEQTRFEDVATAAGWQVQWAHQEEPVQ